MHSNKRSLSHSKQRAEVAPLVRLVFWILRRKIAYVLGLRSKNRGFDPLGCFSKELKVILKIDNFGQGTTGISNIPELSSLKATQNNDNVGYPCPRSLYPNPSKTFQLDRIAERNTVLQAILPTTTPSVPVLLISWLGLFIKISEASYLCARSFN